MNIHEIYPYLCVTGAARAIEFYSSAFGAKEKFRLTEPSGRIGHAEMDFGGMILMLSEEFPEYGIRSASSIGAVRCPFGHRWLIGHSIEEVSTQEMQRRYTAMFETKALGQ